VGLPRQAEDRVDSVGLARLRNLALAMGVLVVLITATTTSIANAQVDRRLYCMPPGHPALRSDGTWGIAVDLVDGQPQTDPTYAGAQPAVAEPVMTIDSLAGNFLDPTVSYSYRLTCDFSATSDCVTKWTSDDPRFVLDGENATLYQIAAASGYPVCFPYVTWQWMSEYGVAPDPFCVELITPTDEYSGPCPVAIPV
jgi:hypothetical protein